MEYRQLPHGTEREKFGVLGLGLGGIGKTPADEIEAIIRKALDHGINYFDLCTAGATYAPFGRAIAGKRDRVFLQVHFGAVPVTKGISSIRYPPSIFSPWQTSLNVARASGDRQIAGEKPKPLQ